MPNDQLGGAEQQRGEGASEPSAVSNPNQDLDPDPDPDLHPVGREEKGGGSAAGVQERVNDGLVLSILISQPEEVANPKGGISKNATPERDEKVGVVVAAKKGSLPRSESYDEQCRICQQQTEEPLLDLGCRCRGELAKAHRSCIEIWFRTRGSNKCEICQQVAVNVPSPEPQPSTNYWVWRVDSAYGGANIGQGERERGCFSPLWIAFAILIGGLLLDVLISVSLGVSALPVNIIIGVLIVLGLGTAIRLAMECCHEWGSRRHVQRVEMTVNTSYHPGV